MTHPQRAPGVLGHLFLSVGAMKAGTTWLYTLLEKHPELNFTPEKELHYFYHKYVRHFHLSDQRRLALAKERYLEKFDPARANPDRVRVNLHWVANYLSRPVDDLWYRNLFTRPRGERYGCDFSNLHALLPAEAWPHIQSSCTELRVLYTMRDPVKRLWSHVKFHLQVTNQLGRLETWSPEECLAFMKQPFIWENAEYGEVLRRIGGNLSEDNFLPFFYEDMRQDPRGSLACIEDFLGISRFDYPEDAIGRSVNKSAVIKMPEYFVGLVADDVLRITDEVRDFGLHPPKSWIL